MKYDWMSFFFFEIFKPERIKMLALLVAFACRVDQFFAT